MVSYFNSIRDKKCKDNISIQKLLQLIKDSPKKEIITELWRLTYKSQAYDMIKETLPCITPHGSFKAERKNDQIDALSGLFYFDIDCNEIETDVESKKQEIWRDYRPYIYALGKSVGGKGLFFYVKVSAIEIPCFSSAYEYVKAKYFR